MKNAAACAKKLNTLLRKLPPGQPPDFDGHDNPVAVLILSFLIWEANTTEALAAYQRIIEHIVDFNDLRVSMPHEVVELLGPRYPRALEHAERIRAALRDVYLREHAVDLSSLNRLRKREARDYLETIDGIVPFVSARVMLMCFDTHAIPVSEQLRTLLIEEGAADESADVPELAAWLARQIRAGEGPNAHLAFQAWIDKTAGARPSSRPRRKSSSKKVGG